MLKNTICLLFFCCLQSTLEAQPQPLQGIRLIDETSNIRVTQLNVHGIRNSPQGPELIYSFIHPRGGIQPADAPAAGGSSQPRPLQAFGFVNVHVPELPTATELSWIADSAVGINVNYFPEPFTDRASYFYDPLATPSMMRPLSKTYAIASTASKSDPPCYIPCYPEPAKSTYPPMYHLTQVDIGKGGDITALKTQTYALKPNLDAPLAGAAPYKRVSSITHPKSGYAAAFEDTDMGFVPGSYSSISDPVTGHAGVFGAIQYRRNAAEESSSYREFKFLMFNKEGEIQANLSHTSQTPLIPDGCYGIKGDQLAPDIEAVTEAVWVLRGGGQNATNADSTKVYVLFFDLKTGRLLGRDSAAFTQPGGRCINQRQRQDGSLELVYLYDEYAPRTGISVMTLEGRQIKSIIDYFSDTEVIPKPGYLPDGPISLHNLFCIPLEEGNVALLQAITAHNSRGLPLNNDDCEPLGYGLFIYQPNGYLETFLPLPLSPTTRCKNICLVYASSDHLVFMVHHEQNGCPGLISLLKVDLSNYTTTLSRLPDGYAMPDACSIYLNRKQKLFYLFAQPIAGKGLYLFHYPL